MEKNYFVHESSYVDEGVSIGRGSKIWHFCHLQKGCVIGESCSLGQNVNVSNNDGTTGVDRMGKHVMNVNGVYDLQGRKLSPITSLKKGIYIINGKKVVK